MRTEWYYKQVWCLAKKIRIPTWDPDIDLLRRRYACFGGTGLE